jgi:PAS domain S-box-containing protein
MTTSLDITLTTQDQTRQALLIGRVINSVLNPDIFNEDITEIIKDCFGLYHVAIYLIDQTGQWAVLSEAAGQASQSMKQVGHRLPLDRESAVGRAAQSLKACLTGPPANPALPQSQAELALPLVIDGRLIGLLDLHSQSESVFSPEILSSLEILAHPVARAINKFQLSAKTVTVRNHLSLLRELSAALSTDLDLDSILTTAISFTRRFEISPCEIYLLADTDTIFFKSSNPSYDTLTEIEKQALVRLTLSAGLAVQVVETGQPTLISDTKYETPGINPANDYLASCRSLICAPLVVEPDRLHGIILFAHPEPNHFDRQQLELLKALATQLTTALKNAVRLTEIQNSLRETHLMLDYSRRLSGVYTLNDVYTIFAHGMLAIGADRCTLYLCDLPGSDPLPTHSEVVAVGEVDPTKRNEGLGYVLSIAPFLIFDDLIRNQNTLIIDGIGTDERLTPEEKEFFQRFGAQSAVVEPLVSRDQVIGLIAVEYRHPHSFSERDLALFRTLCNQTTIAIEHVRQVQRTEAALSETQTLYRAGRVLAGAADLHEILQQALIEFVYSLGLDQGDVILLTPDRRYGQVMAYVQDSRLQEVEKPKVPINENLLYHQVLLSGQPFVSVDAPNDPRLEGFISFNQTVTSKSLMEAPMIIRGETIGWIGSSSVKQYHHFTQQEIDLARAMADQIAITIQNRRLLEQTELRATRLSAVAKIGEAISRMLDLEEIFNTTVDLIRDRFGFYHVSIFLVDEAQEWAVVHASTGEVGKIMVERPHRLQVGGNSIVGFVTATATPRIALDVGEDAIHFKNPLLPATRAEMALPLVSRGLVIGALDVQSTEANAFSDEDIDTLQIMADQLTNAIANARLFHSAQTSRMFLKSVVNVLPVGVFAKEVQAGYRFSIWNAKMEELFATKSQDILGKTDYDLFVKAEADYFRRTDIAVMAAGQIVDIPVEEITTSRGVMLAHTTKLPIFDSQGNPEILLGVLEDITERKQAEVALQTAFERTQSLYRISNALATSTDQQATIGVVLSEYLQLLHLERGFIVLKDSASHFSKIQLLLAGQPGQSEVPIPIEEDTLLQHFAAAPTPTTIEHVSTHPLTQSSPWLRELAETMLLIPLIGRDKVFGVIGAASNQVEHRFASNDIEIGEAIADQLTVWLDNRQLLQEAQYRLGLLQTAAEVSRASSSILDADELINTSVNLIRDQFNFYYVGLFLVDADREWAVLRAGTGEAGRIQLEKHHQLKIGGESMIGWCVQNRQARIALDVGLEAVRFRNPYLPNTRSEMALPLVSRDIVIGALTVQSSERGAFFNEDITLLQTMADQLANAIENARLFAQTQEALLQTENLYRVTQELLSARDEETVYRLAMQAMAHTNIDTAAIYMYLEGQTDEIGGQVLEQKATWIANDQASLPNGTRFHSKEMIVEQLIPQHGALVIEDTNSNDPSLTDQLRRHLALLGIKSLVALPLSTYQRRLGFLLVAHKTPGKTFSPQNIRYFSTVAQQMVVALENLRLLDDSQRRARREEIIREITGKIRSANTIEDILKTTVTELGQVLGAVHGGVMLRVTTPQDNILPSHASQHHLAAPNRLSDNGPALAGGKGTKRYDQ